MRRFIRLMLLGTLLLVFTGWSCDYCLLVQGVSPLETAIGKGLRFDQRYTRLSTLFDNGEEINNEGISETHWTSQFSGFYSFTPQIMMLAVVPVVKRIGEGEHHGEEGEAIVIQSRVNPSFSKTPGSWGTLSPAHGEEGNTASAFGLGDISLLGRYRFVERHSTTTTLMAAVQLGVRFPTGSTSAKNDQGEVLEAHLQPGTGAFNFLMGAAANYVKDRVGFVANGLYSIATEGKVGDETYQYGNSLNYDASFRYRFINSIQSDINLFGALGVAGEYRGKEKQSGIELENTGGNTLYLAPGIQLYVQKFVFELSYWQAVAHNLNGTQLGEDFKTYGGITYLLR